MRADAQIDAFSLVDEAFIPAPLESYETHVVIDPFGWQDMQTAFPGPIANTFGNDGTTFHTQKKVLPDGRTDGLRIAKFPRRGGGTSVADLSIIRRINYAMDPIPGPNTAYPPLPAWGQYFLTPPPNGTRWRSQCCRAARQLRDAVHGHSGTTVEPDAGRFDMPTDLSQFPCPSTDSPPAREWCSSTRRGNAARPGWRNG